MMKDLKDETGITLTELLAVIILVAMVTTLVATMASHVFTIRNIQEYKVKTQTIANSLYNELNTYSNELLINQKQAGGITDTQSLGESGKYRRNDWEDKQIVQLLDGSNDQPLTFDSDGVEKLKLVTHEGTRVLSTYQTPSTKIKMKVHFVKNKHEKQVLKQGETNYRDSFSVDTTVYIVFYKGTINWTAYIPGKNKPMEMDDVKKDKDTIYTRVFDITYRDDAKSAGEVAGNGRW